MNYEASDIEVLAWHEAVRRRPTMYIGDVGALGLVRLLRQLADVPLRPNSILVICAGSTFRIEAACVPPSLQPRNPASAAYLIDACTALTVPPSSPPSLAGEEVLDTATSPARFERAPVTPTSLAIANALSKTFSIGSISRGIRTELDFERGRLTRGPTSSGTGIADGLAISFEPDPEIFASSRVPFSLIAEMVRDLAFIRGVPAEARDAKSGARYSACTAG